MYKFTKRSFCIIACSCAILVLLPIFFIAIIGILLSDWGPVFYCAQRIGKDCKPFKMYKFRSMKVDKSANEINFKADISRIFKWGAFMRATKIDELPQLFNCLLGDMAIVGPRPVSQDQVAIMHEGKFAIASCVRPGLTGPAALYDYLYGDFIEDETDYKKKVLPTRRILELYYVQHMNITFDIKMIWWTLKCIIFRIMGRNMDKTLNKLILFADISKLENQIQ